MLHLRPVLRIRITDPGSGMEKNPGPGSGIDIPDHISENLETITKILWNGFGSGIFFLLWIRDGKIRIRDPD
jgi:hypothetical protein